MANRLSEDPSVTVLVLEAGSSELRNPTISAPLASPEIQLTEHDWAFRTVPQNNACLAMVNKVSYKICRLRNKSTRLSTMKVMI